MYVGAREGQGGAVRRDGAHLELFVQFVELRLKLSAIACHVGWLDETLPEPKSASRRTRQMQAVEEAGAGDGKLVETTHDGKGAHKRPILGNWATARDHHYYSVTHWVRVGARAVRAGERYLAIVTVPEESRVARARLEALHSARSAAPTGHAPLADPSNCTSRLRVPHWGERRRLEGNWRALDDARYCVCYKTQRQVVVLPVVATYIVVQRRSRMRRFVDEARR